MGFESQYQGLHGFGRGWGSVPEIGGGRGYIWVVETWGGVVIPVSFNSLKPWRMQERENGRKA